MVRRGLFVFLIFITFACSQPKVYLFSFFQGNGEDGLHLATSKDGQYVMFLKNEIKHPEAEKNIRVATSDHLLGPYTSASEPITDNWVEGPTAIETDQGWVVYFDRYTNHGMGAVRSTDLKNWTDISEKVTFPEGTRHGTVLKVSKKIVDNL